MIALSEADDLHEIIRNVARENGRDMADMHAIADEVLGMPVGDSTPTPGSLLVEPPSLVLPAPLHEGLAEPPEGKFYLPPFITATSMPRQVRRLSRRVSELTYWLTGLTMCFISAVFVIAWRW